jgi:hypothetical protein
MAYLQITLDISNENARQPRGYTRNTKPRF